MSVNLTPNAIPAIVAGDVNSKLLVQVLDIALISNSNSNHSQQQRYHLFISDAVSSHHAILATQLNDLVQTGRVKKGSVVQLLHCIYTPLDNRNIIVVINMETIAPDCEIIGNPKLFVEPDLSTQRVLPDNTVENSSMSNSNNQELEDSLKKLKTMNQAFRSELEKTQKAHLALVTGLQKEIDGLMEKANRVDGLEDSLHLLEEEKKKIEEDLAMLTKEKLATDQALQEALDSKAKLADELENLKDEATNQRVVGYETGLQQAKLLNPDGVFDNQLGELSPLKQVVDGQIVDAEEEEEVGTADKDREA